MLSIVDALCLIVVLMAHIATILASNLKRLRKSKGWNQSQLAEAAALSREFIAKVETEAAWVGPDTIEAIARAFEASESELFRDPESIMRPSPKEALEVLAELVSRPRQPGQNK